MEITTKEELFTIIQELQGQVANMQEQLDKQNPVAEEAPVTPEETEPEAVVSEEEISEIDKLLQED